MGYKWCTNPRGVIRELRKLFSQYQLLNRQIRVLKNNIQAILSENGVHLPKEMKDQLLSAAYGMAIVDELELTPASELNVRSCLELLWRVGEEKERIRKEILLSGEPLKEAVKLLITIKGVAPLVALAFLADVGDIERFPSSRKMNAYLAFLLDAGIGTELSTENPGCCQERIFNAKLGPSNPLSTNSFINKFFNRFFNADNPVFAVFFRVLGVIIFFKQTEMTL